MSAPKIILFDIETIPNLDEAMKVWCQLGSWPGRTMKATITSIISVGWKELGKKHTHCINAWDFPSWENDINDDKALCKAIHKIMSEADCVITHNGKRFDWKYLQTRFMLHNLPPLPNIPHVDTCLVARKNLLSFNNKLDYLGEHFVKDKKMENGGWDLWVKVSKRKKTAQKLMDKYCRQDVKLLEKLFLRLRPFVKNLPNKNIDHDNINFEKVCPSCGSADVYYNGWAYTKTNKYPRIHCKSCGSYSRLDNKGNNPRSI
jgi:DNA polymerase elongation subunit (family B)